LGNLLQGPLMAQEIQSKAQPVALTPDGLSLSSFVQGYWRLADWQMTNQQRLDFLKQHIELGITSVDHASIYGSPSCESLFGEALALEPSLRKDIQIVTKCGIHLQAATDSKRVSHYTSSKPQILESVEKSLIGLKTDYLDLLLLHRPDFLLDADEVAEAFNSLRIQGKVRHFGVSNYSPSQFSLLQSRLEFPLATNQLEINPVNLGVIHDGSLDQMQQLRTRPMAWSALAGGRIFTGDTPQLVRLRKVISEIADEIGADSVDQVIYQWILNMPSKPVIIIGSGKIARLKSALNSQKLSLSREQWYRIWVASTGHNVP
jgi:predicted oxidoreductase